MLFCSTASPSKCLTAATVMPKDMLGRQLNTNIFPLSIFNANGLGKHRTKMETIGCSEVYLAVPAEPVQHAFGMKN